MKKGEGRATFAAIHRKGGEKSVIQGHSVPRIYLRTGRLIGSQKRSPRVKITNIQEEHHELSTEAKGAHHDVTRRMWSLFLISVFRGLQEYRLASLLKNENSSTAKGDSSLYTSSGEGRLTLSWGLH